MFLLLFIFRSIPPPLIPHTFRFLTYHCSYVHTSSQPHHSLPELIPFPPLTLIPTTPTYSYTFAPALLHSFAFSLLVPTFFPFFCFSLGSFPNLFPTLLPTPLSPLTLTRSYTSSRLPIPSYSYTLPSSRHVSFGTPSPRMFLVPP